MPSITFFQTFFSMKGCIDQHIARDGDSARKCSLKFVKTHCNLKNGLDCVESGQFTPHDRPLDAVRVVSCSSVLQLYRINSAPYDGSSGVHASI